MQPCADDSGPAAFHTLAVAVLHGVATSRILAGKTGRVNG